MDGDKITTTVRMYDDTDVLRRNRRIDRLIDPLVYLAFNIPNDFGPRSHHAFLSRCLTD